MNEAGEGKGREERVPASSRRPVLARTQLMPFLRGECLKRAAAGIFGTKPPEVGATQLMLKLGKERPHNAKLLFMAAL